MSEPLALKIAEELTAQNMLAVPCVTAMFVIERVLDEELKELPEQSTLAKEINMSPLSDRNLEDHIKGARDALTKVALELLQAISKFKDTLPENYNTPAVAELSVAAADLKRALKKDS